MKRRGNIRFLANPAIGILPFFINDILLRFWDYKMAILLSFIVSLLLTIYSKYQVRYKFYHFLLFISDLVFGTILVLSFLPLDVFFEKYMVVIPEILLLIMITLSFYKGRKIVKSIYLSTVGAMLVDLRKSLHEFFYFGKMLFAAVFSFLAIFMVYMWISRKSLDQEFEVAIDIQIIMYIALIMFEQIRVMFINYKIRKEEWLPIIDEDARVIGQIAKSVSYSSKEKYLHPMVRILILSKGKIFLSKLHGKSNRNVYDTPTQRDLSYEESFNSCVSSLMKSVYPASQLNPNYIYKYTHESELRRRMVFLYAINIEKASVLKAPFFHKGKFWTESELDNNMGKGVFDECFELEYPLMKMTALQLWKK